MQFALDYLIPFPCIGVWRQNLISLLFMPLFSFPLPLLQDQQAELVCKEIRQISIESKKLFDMQNNPNLENYIFVTFCHLMFLVLAGRNDTQLWQSIGILLFSKI